MANDWTVRVSTCPYVYYHLNLISLSTFVSMRKGTLKGKSKPHSEEAAPTVGWNSILVLLVRTIVVLLPSFLPSGSTSGAYYWMRTT